jgi:hypothetical protein
VTAVEDVLRLREPGGESVGSAVVVGSPPILLTCAHVIAGLKAVDVLAADGTLLCTLQADRFAADDGRDLAAAAVAFEMGSRARPAQDAPPRSGLCWAGYPYAELRVAGPLIGEGTKGATTAIVIGDTTVPAWQLLGGPPIAAGMSGGPVIDRESGAVVGLASAEFQELVDGRWSRAPGLAGFCVPLDGDIGTATVRRLVAAALESIPRLGPAPNLAGAALLAQRHQTRARAYAQEMLDFDPARTVARETIESTVAQFNQSGKTIMPLLGDSGVGKSTLLNHIAEPDNGLRALLVRGAEIEAAADVATALEEALRLGGLVREGAVLAPSLEAWARTLGPALLLVDGLNETTTPLARVGGAWGRELADLLRNLGWKAVITSRPEYWASARHGFREGDLFQETIEEPIEGGGPRVRVQPFHLGDFSTDEAAAFFDHNPDVDFARAHGVSHPLTLELGRRFGVSHRDRPVDLPDLLRAYLDDGCDRIGRKAGDPMSGLRARRLCEALARKLLLRGASLVRLEDASESEQTLLDGLIAENILIAAAAAAGGWRFRYDQVLEHLQASHVGDLATLVLDPDLRDPGLGASIPIAVVAARLRQLGADGAREQVQAVLRAAAERDRAYLSTSCTPRRSTTTTCLTSTRRFGSTSRPRLTA